MTIVGLLRQRNRVGTSTFDVSNKYYYIARLKWISLPYVCKIFTGRGLSDENEWCIGLNILNMFDIYSDS